MKSLVELFSAHCTDRGTLDDLAEILSDKQHWPKAHALFNKIRGKTLRADRENDSTLIAQYLFEEICAKTIFNLSGCPAPFDSDSPYWVVPNALVLARKLSLGDAPVLGIVVYSK